MPILFTLQLCDNITLHAFEIHQACVIDVPIALSDSHVGESCIMQSYIFPYARTGTSRRSIRKGTGFLYKLKQEGVFFRFILSDAHILHVSLLTAFWEMKVLCFRARDRLIKEADGVCSRHERTPGRGQLQGHSSLNRYT